MIDKRLLDFSASDYLNATPIELKQAIFAAEGRTVLAENVPTRASYLEGVTNAELEKIAGADLILFNVLNVLNPKIYGVPKEYENEPISWIKKAIGRAIGVNLEPIDPNAEMSEKRSEIDIGRIVSPKTLKAANTLSFDYICLTGNPGTGVSNEAIIKAISLSHKYFKGLIFAGKMHGAGVSEPVMNLNIAKKFIEQGIDVLLVPAPYTVPLFTETDLQEIARYLRSFNKNKGIKDKVLLMTANGTSQDSADTETIRKIGLSSKAAGADIQHIGDSFNGICLPQNIFALGEAIRGKRHQLRLIAQSPLR